MLLTDFLAGNSFDAYDFFGAHFQEGCTVFRVYAPRAARVTLEGDFTGWQEWDAAYHEKGIWVFHVFNAWAGQNYKYVTYSRRGRRQEHADPYGYGMGSYGCSVIRDIWSYEFRDQDWMTKRSLNFDRPMNIYELHLGSWLRDKGKYTSYDGIADRLIGYLKANHYTHVEFMPLNEHPLDGSWGYQATGFFSPTARFGEAWQLMNLVDRLHRAGIGAILDFVCVHFAVDHYGLKMFDGSALFESSKTANRKSDWGSISFEHTKGPVRSFLKSAAHYWLEKYHFDGLRFDAVSRLLYGHGEPRFGENPGGIAFLKEINAGLEQLHPTAMRIAEDSTAFSGVTHPVQEGGLGFHYKWAMGWTFDSLGFFFGQRDNWRLTGSLGYWDTERFILPISHDTMGGSGKALLSRMPGIQADKLRQMKLLYLYMLAHPGKKLLFLGSELGTFTSWNVHTQVDHIPLFDSKTAGFVNFCRELNQLYLDSPALFEADDAPWCAQWVCSGENGCFALLRHSQGQHLLLVLNTSAEDQEQWFPLDGASNVRLLLHSQWTKFGGKVSQKETPIRLENGWAGVKLPKYSGMIGEVFY